MATEPNTTNVVSIATARRCLAPRSEPLPPISPNAPLALMLAICSALHTGSKTDRKVYRNIRWALGRGQGRNPDDPAFDGAFLLLDAVETAACRGAR